jgi:[ribosomal protein S5]-alanine N-acetyltransferase
VILKSFFEIAFLGILIFDSEKTIANLKTNSMPAFQAKDFCFTLNNYTEDELNGLKRLENEERICYLVCGYESGESGTPHLQGFVQFERKISLAGIIKLFGSNRLHLEIRRGTPEQAAEYCKKENDYFEFGSIRTHGQGHRSDLVRAKKMLEQKQEFRLEIGNSFYISDICAEDESSLVEYLNNREIYDHTLMIPFPYTLQHARDFISIICAQKQDGKSINWAIREPSGKLIGGIGIQPFESHKTSIGYWLGKPFRNQGIMTRAVIAVTDYVFKEYPQIMRIEAHVFEFNLSSPKVLLKAGYQFEGLLRKYHRKGEKIIGSRLHAKIRED